MMVFVKKVKPLSNKVSKLMTKSLMNTINLKDPL